MKNKKLTIIVMAIAVVAIGVAIAIMLTKNGENGRNNKKEIPDELAVDEVITDVSASGIEVKTIQNIAGIYVEDGSNEVMDNIFTVDFFNASDYYLQYAEIILTIDGEEYNFELTTIPAGETVRVMEKNRSEMPVSCEKCEMRSDHIAWFSEAPSLHSDAIEIVEQDGGLVLKNTSARSIQAPIYVYYKNCVDDIYVGGITYRATVKEELPTKQAIAIGADHFSVGYSRIMFVEYAE